MPDGGFEMKFPTAPHALVPHFEVNADMGNFVYAVSTLQPGKTYLAEGTTCSWTEYMRLWSEVTKVPASYQQISVEELVKIVPDEEFAREVADMFLYSSEPGYDGGVGTTLHASDIREV
jgi:hypothetical protein